MIGSLNLVGGLLLMLLGAFGAPQGVEGAILFAAGLLSLVVGVGLLQLRPWARKASIGGYLLNVMVGVARANLLVIGISSLILIYLFSGKVKEAFAPQPVAPPQVVHPLPQDKRAA